MRFKDRVALVTGAGSSIGRATARRLAAEGAAVVTADLDEAGLAAVAAEIEAVAACVAGRCTRPSWRARPTPESTPTPSSGPLA